jgi:hypothetical protein
VSLIRRAALAICMVSALAACTSVASGVRVAANPAPPHTYWAPEGSVIRNHPTSPGIWVAEDGAGERVAFYFGDACGAAERQVWVGQSRQALPDLTPSRLLRLTEPDMVVTSDLIFARLNVSFDAQDRVVDVSCG